MSARRGLWIGAIAALSSACSFIVEFHDKEDDASTDAGGFEAGSIRPDGAVVLPDGAVEVDGSLPPDDGAVVVPDVVVPFTCVGKPDGTVTDRGNDRYRCCGGVETDLGTNTNCGGCGIACNVGAGHSCQNRRGHFVCVGCQNDGGGGGGACWTGCCAAPFLSPDGVCVPAFPCGFPTCGDDTCKSAAGQASGCDVDGIDFPYCHY